MSLRRLGTLFSGAGLVETPCPASDITLVWSIEIETAIAEVYQRNHGKHCLTADVAMVNPQDLDPITDLWASMSCQQASVAPSKNLPPRSDFDVGLQILRYVQVLRPESAPERSQICSAISLLRCIA